MQYYDSLQNLSKLLYLKFSMPKLNVNSLPFALQQQLRTILKQFVEKDYSIVIISNDFQYSCTYIVLLFHCILSYTILNIS
jgi:hypothetical protein